MSTSVSLMPIDRDGSPRGHTVSLPEVTREVFRATAELYAKADFEEPWIGYLALAAGTAVGTCGFKSPPRDGRVEIAYFTFPEFEGRGIAAQTLPQRNASHRVLEKLGFQRVGTVDHPEDGTVWEWQLGDAAGS